MQGGGSVSWSMRSRRLIQHIGTLLPETRELTLERWWVVEMDGYCTRSSFEGLDPARPRRRGPSSFWRVLGRIYRELGQRSAAVSALRKAAALAPRDHLLAIELARALMDRDSLIEAWAIFDRIRDEAGDRTPGWLVGFQVCNILTGNFAAFEQVMIIVRRLPMAERRLVKQEILCEVARICALWKEPEPELPAGAIGHRIESDDAVHT